MYLRKLNTLLELPVANVVVLTAIRDKPTPVRKQVMLEITVGTFKLSLVFLVIPHLSSKLIIGGDWMMRLRMVIDFSCRSVVINGARIPSELLSFGRAPSERLNVSTDNEFTYIQTVRVAEAKAQLKHQDSNDDSIRRDFDNVQESQQSH